MFILTKIGPEWYFINQKADGIDFFYIICFSIIPIPTTLHTPHGLSSDRRHIDVVVFTFLLTILLIKETVPTILSLFFNITYHLINSNGAEFIEPHPIYLLKSRKSHSLSCNILLLFNI